MFNHVYVRDTSLLIFVQKQPFTINIARSNSLGIRFWNFFFVCKVRIPNLGILGFRLNLRNYNPVKSIFGQFFVRSNFPRQVASIRWLSKEVEFHMEFEKFCQEITRGRPPTASPTKKSILNSKILELQYWFLSHHYFETTVRNLNLEKRTISTENGPFFLFW